MAKFAMWRSIHWSEVMAEGYLKLFREVLNWEWYKNPNTCRVFIHCLLKANWKDTTWRGIPLQAGQFATSLETLSKETHLTVKQIRTALDHLKETGEITSETWMKKGQANGQADGQANGQANGQAKGQPQCRIITVIKWSEYQEEGKPKGKEMGNKRASQRAIDKEYKEYKKKRIYTRARKTDTDYDGLAKELME